MEDHTNNGKGERADDKTLKATRPELYELGWRPVQGFLCARLGSQRHLCAVMASGTAERTLLGTHSYVWLRKWRANSKRWTKTQRWDLDEVIRAGLPLDKALLRQALRHGFDERGEFIVGGLPS